MAVKLQFYDKVAIVTGAGGGLGRQYALQLAKRGAALVVNDLGGSRDGDGKSNNTADIVVEEIKSAGGQATADYNSVEEGDKIVRTAIDKYGKVDIIINNAGIIRDRSFVKMSLKDWDLVHNVHLRGSFLVTKAAWPYLRRQNYGKVIFTSSAAGIFGNFGQANYSAAKLGLVGLCKSLAIEGAKHNICCNTVIPTAMSRLTEDLFPSDIQQLLNPEYVAPLVTWLTNENCNENGGIFETGAGWIGKYEYYRSKGMNVFNERKEVSAENIANNWEEITDMTDSEALQNIQAQISSLVMSASQRLNNRLSSLYTYKPKDAILYALSVGSSLENQDDFKFLYENHENFSVIPTYGTIPAMNFAMNDFEKISLLISKKFQHHEISFVNTLHGEHYMEVLSPLSVDGGTLTSTLEIADILDKVSGILIVLNIHTCDESGNNIYFNQANVFITEGGGFGGKRSSNEVIPVVNVPNREPDTVLNYKTSTDHSALYRLNGDVNPLHIDPEVSKLGGFSQPILHGLCSLGIATRHVLSAYGENNPSKFKCVKARFANPLLPGQTVLTRMWKENSRIHFEVTALETGKTIISNAYIDLILPEGSKSSNSKSSEVFQEIGRKISKSLDLITEAKVAFRWNIVQGNEMTESWIIDLNEKPSIYIDESQSVAANCVLTCDEKTLICLVNKTLDAKAALKSGALKIEGNLRLMQKLEKLFQVSSKL